MNAYGKASSEKAATSHMGRGTLGKERRRMALWPRDVVHSNIVPGCSWPSKVVVGLVTKEDVKYVSGLGGISPMYILAPLKRFARRGGDIVGVMHSKIDIGMFATSLVENIRIASSLPWRCFPAFSRKL
jgi:hypothetical protein